MYPETIPKKDMFMVKKTSAPTQKKIKKKLRFF